MKSLTQFLKESFISDSEKAPEIVTKHLGLKYATGEGNSEETYTMAGSKGYMERGKVDGLDNVFVTVGWYNSLLRKDASIFVYTTAKANSKTMRLAACYGLDQKELERLYDAFSNDLSLFNILLLITNSFFSNQCPSPFLHTIQSLLKYDGICIYQVKDNINYNCIV